MAVRINKMKPASKGSLDGNNKRLKRKHLLLRCAVLIFGVVEIIGGWKHTKSLLYEAREGYLWEPPSQSISSRYCSRYPKKRTVGLKNVALHHVNARWTNATLVNTSATAQLLPGSFLKDRLYLMGARLTPSYDEDDASVILTLFGIPGQGKFGNSDEFHCKTNLSQSIWSHGRTSSEMILYAQLDCHINGTSYQTCGPPIEMSRIETISLDSNVNELSLIWQANISQWLAREDLKLLPPESQLCGSIRVHFSARMEPSIESVPNHQTIQPLLTVDIPLATGSVGNVGPREPLRQSNGLEASYFSLPPMGATLCVGTFGTVVHPFLLEFIQHHRNVGFGQIILGVLDFDDSMADPISYWKRLLGSFADDGSVVLVPAGAPGMECHTELLKVAFYNSCLYYTKGISQYVGIWDVDEYWVPEPTSDEASALQGAVTPRLDSDRLTVNTRNSNSGSAVVDAMTRLANYHRRHGCENQDWCFHGFPSFTVHRKQTLEGQEIDYNHTTKHLLVDLFEQSDKDSNKIWLKSIAQTKYAFSAGYHEFGSCLRPNATHAWDVVDPGETDLKMREQSYEEAYSTICRNLRILGFGSMHHFKNLVTSRDEIPDLKDVDRYPRDEYIQHYGRAFATQQLQISNASTISAQ